VNFKKANHNTQETKQWDECLIQLFLFHTFIWKVISADCCFWSFYLKGELWGKN